MWPPEPGHDELLAEPRPFFSSHHFDWMRRTALRASGSVLGRAIRANHRRAPAKFGWLLTILVAAVVAFVHLNAVRGAPDRSSASDRLTALEPPVVQQCPAIYNCLTTATVPATLIASVRAAFPSATVTRSASAFDSAHQEVALQQVCLVSENGTSIVLTQQRNERGSTSIGHPNIQRLSGSAGVLVSQQRGAWLMTATIASAGAARVSQAAVRAAEYWTVGTIVSR